MLMTWSTGLVLYFCAAALFVPRVTYVFDEEGWLRTWMTAKRKAEEVVYIFLCAILLPVCLPIAYFYYSIKKRH
jgi:hypothetical protein